MGNALPIYISRKFVSHSLGNALPIYISRKFVFHSLGNALPKVGKVMERKNALQKGVDGRMAALRELAAKPDAEKQTNQLEESAAPPALAPSAFKPTQVSEGKLAVLQQNIGKVISMPLSDLLIEDNVRQEVAVNSPEFRELIESIRERGILQNLIAELRQEDEPNWRLVCIAGQRRLLAAREAQVTRGPVLLRQNLSESERIAEALAENLLREGLHPLDIAEGYARLIAEGWKKDQIEARFGRGRKTVERYLTLAKYPVAVKTQLRQHRELFTVGVLFNEFAAQRWSSHESLQAAVAARIAKAEAEREGKPKSIKPRGRSAKSDFEKALALELQAATGNKVIVKGSKHHGVIKLAYQSEAEIIELSRRLKAKPL